MRNTPPATTALLKEKAMCPTAVSGTAVLDLGGTQGAEAVLVALLGKSCGVEEAQRRHGSDLRGWVERGAGALLANHTLTLGEGASTSGAGHSRSGRGGALGSGGRLATFSVLSPYDILPVRSSMSSMLLLLASAGFSVSSQTVLSLPLWLLYGLGRSCCGSSGDGLGSQGRGRVQAPVSPCGACETILEEHALVRRQLSALSANVTCHCIADDLSAGGR